MSLHTITLSPSDEGEPETLLNIVDALGFARDLSNMLAIGSETLTRGHRNAFATTATILEDAIEDIITRLRAIEEARVAP